MVANFRGFDLHEFLNFEKFEDDDFKYDNNFSQISLWKYPSKVFLFPNSKIFVFAQNFGVWQIRSADSHLIIVFQTNNSNTPK